jgi:hypothetical protein
MSLEWNFNQRLGIVRSEWVSRGRGRLKSWMRKEGDGYVKRIYGKDATDVILFHTFTLFQTKRVWQRQRERLLTQKLLHLWLWLTQQPPLPSAQLKAKPYLQSEIIKEMLPNSAFRFSLKKSQVSSLKKWKKTRHSIAHNGKWCGVSTIEKLCTLLHSACSTFHCFLY